MDKRMQYEEDIKLPLFVLPTDKSKEGSNLDAMVSTADIAPTFLELAGIKSNHHFDGVSWAGLV